MKRYPSELIPNVTAKTERCHYIRSWHKFADVIFSFNSQYLKRSKKLLPEQLHNNLKTSVELLMEVAEYYGDVVGKNGIYTSENINDEEDDEW